MATKSKVNGLNGVHPAGIFADMTVDGPEIGTLVVIVDRAKNLPNRKTIGKQDPYCAARLGKEAKKTETDRRGGQTPKWDQELRFTVHDSPDYYQLKVSVFNDDKKTEIIGETWVDLKEVVVSGGGQNDLWHNLSFKGKYAGEIRIEITYYDTRPKEEKPQKVRQSATNGAQDGPRETLSGPRQPKALAPVKRRPLPSDPVPGAQPSPPSAPVPAPSAIPDHVQNSPRGHRRPSVSEATAATPEPGPAPMPNAIPDHVQTPPRGYQTPSYVQEQSPLQRVEYSTPPHRLSQSQSYGQNSGRQNGYTQSPGNQHGYGTSQAMVIATPPSQQTSQDRYEIYDPGNSDYSSGNGGSYEEEHIDPRDHYNSRQATYDLPPPDQYGGPPSPGGPPPPPPAHGSKHVSPAPPMSSHGSYGFPSNTATTRQTNPYEPSSSDIHRQSMQPYAQPKVYEAYSSPKEDEPFRRSGGYQPQQLQLRQHPYDNANAQEQSGYHQQLQLRKNSYDGSRDAQEQSGSYQQQLQLRRNSFNAASNAQEQSGGFPQQLQLRKNSYNAGKNPQEQSGAYSQQLQLRKNSYNAGSNSQEQSLSRHYSYDSSYDNHYGSMQPTVEDAPPTPSPGHYNAHRGSFSRTPQYDAGRYDQVPSPAPLNLRDRGNSASGRNSALSSSPSHHPSTSSNGYASTVGSDLSLYRDQSSVSSFRDQSVVSSRTSYNSLPNYAPQRRQSEDQMAGSPIGYGMPQVPTSLVAGMDPDIAKEISERIYNEKRASQSAGNSPRGRYHEAPSYQQGQNRPHPLSYHEAASQPFVPAAATYDEQQSRYSTGTMGSMNNHRAVSPDTRGTVVRRGVSPDPRSGRRAISPDLRGTMVRRGVSPDPRTGRRAISPNPQGTIARRGISPDPRSGTIRKSVSPAPGPSDVRRLSGVPFGPDSYDALNPALSGSTSSKSLSDRYDSNEIDPDAKIITHDGREIDPSDHIPESNYAPLRETAQPKYASQLPDRNYRPPGGSSVPASGRKQLKVAPTRPSSMAATGVIFSGGIPDSAPPTGRNRLQKKTNRMSAQPAQQSSPLAPITSYQDNNYTPRGLPRANTGDFSGENYVPPHNYGGNPGYRAITSGPPAVPAKVPMNQNYGGYNQGPPPQASGGDPWALLEEMRNIDLGNGRARRRNY